MAGRGFTIPTALGSFLRDLAQEVNMQTERARLAKVLQEELVRERRQREEQARRPVQRVRLAWFVVGVLIVAFWYVLLR